MDEMNGLHEIPSSWAWVRIGDVIGKPSLSGKKLPQKEYQPKGKLPVIDQGQLFIGGYTDRVELKLDCEPPVIIFGDHTKAIKYVGFDFVAGADGIKVLKPSNIFYPKLFYYFLQGIDLPDKGYARHFQFLEKSNIPLPPLSEQHRIVAKIEELFTKLDAGVEALRKAQAQLKRYRQAVLKAAVTGELTKEWREAHQVELEPASALLARILKERREKWETNQLAKMKATGKTPKNDDWKQKYQKPAPPNTSDLPELPEGWLWTNVNSVLVEPVCNGISIKGADTPPGIPALKLSAMSEHGFKYEYIRYLPLIEDEVKDLFIKEGDFFVSRGNGSKHLVGRGTLAQSPPFNVIFSDLMIRLRLASDLKELKWLYLIWPSRIVREQIERKAKTTAGIWKVAQPDVTSISFPLLPLAEQHQIVAEVERLFSITDAMERTIEQSLKQAERLRQSILKQAFTGKLVPQDAGDEPAEMLLERIREEREKRATGKPKKASPRGRRKDTGKQIELLKGAAN